METNAKEENIKTEIIMDDSLHIEENDVGEGNLLECGDALYDSGQRVFVKYDNFMATTETVDQIPNIIGEEDIKYETKEFQYHSGVTNFQIEGDPISVIKIEEQLHTTEKETFTKKKKAALKRKGKRSYKKIQDKPHECEICKKHFAYIPQLSRHMNSHTGNRPYKCQYCEASFGDPSTKIKHERIHTKERPYKCKICNKAFAYSNVLKVHLLTHTGEKPYSCKFCGKCFARLYRKNTHENRHIKTNMVVVPNSPNFEFMHIEENYVGEESLLECGDVSCDDGQKLITKCDNFKAITETDVQIPNINEHTKFKVKEFESHGNSSKDSNFHNEGTPTADIKIKEEVQTEQKVFAKETKPAAKKKRKRIYKKILHTDKQHECEICKKRFTDKPQLSRHMNSHTGNRPYKCQYCEASFGHPSTKKKHERIHTNERPYKCNLCNKAFGYSNVLKAHLLTHTGEKPHSCKFCARSFSRLHRKNSHEKRHNKINMVVVPNSSNIEFMHIEENYVREESLLECGDFSYEDGQILFSKCDNFMAITETDAQMPNINEHTKFKAKDVKSHENSSKDSNFHNEGDPTGDIKIKEEVQTEQKVFAKETKPAAKKKRKRIYKKILDKDKQHECEICKKRFTTKPQLSRHMNSHTGNRPYKCQYCEASFGHPSTKVKHERIHTNERPYKCNLCDKAFSYSNVLKVHLMTHTGEKPHSCKFCGKTFSQLHHKNAHEKRHNKVNKIFVPNSPVIDFMEESDIKYKIEEI